MRDWLILVILIALSIIIGRWHDRRASEGYRDPVTPVIRFCVLPLQSVLVKSTGAIGNFTMSIVHAPSIKQKADQLQNTANENVSLNARVVELEFENQRLRQMLNLPQAKSPKWATGEIIASYINQDTISVYCNQSNTIKIGAPVVTFEGVVGRVMLIQGNVLEVDLLSNSDTSLSVRIQRTDSRALGICKGQSELLLDVDYVSPGSDIREGDMVVTSGFSEFFPDGLIIGRIHQVWTDPVYNTKHAKVKPAVNFDKLEEVFILK